MMILCMHACLYGWMDRWMDEFMYVRMDGWMDVMDVCMLWMYDFDVYM